MVDTKSSSSDLMALDPEARAEDASWLGRLIGRPVRLFSAVFGLWALWLALSVGLSCCASSCDEFTMASGGQFGDWFGAINALFTALAFGAVVWSATLQRQEMEMQRKELSLQRQAVEEQRKELAEQRKVFAQQAFESTFFQMLDHCRELHEAITIDGHVFGLRAVKEIAGRCLRCLNEMGAPGERNGEELRRQLESIYENFVFADHGALLGPYFRALYHLFKLITLQDQMPETTKRQYANMARAHLNDHDLIVLAVNVSSSHGEKFRPMVARFGLLKHLHVSSSIHDTIIRRLFPPEAFLGADEIPTLDGRPKA